ncbi:hypothetical protein ASPZODRAFT_1503356 [Penicilliopsis zonata CBS 506.65]|uniref:F-box domain-containing protein n=1 Tax=Penicilliopsis zonata CBS 506.65 TaxID=1073090 RepID=A0A1L9S4X0_9EURO|nr:hypothetical protein ASPZODRAFT_1503356 [Penicilliopsis zonata CBS 506.65]OJJ42218.1 hypothetical protein ASPZODRAFT_1503356 [Penicilliopsis zonata CBS 506.65]
MRGNDYWMSLFRLIVYDPDSCHHRITGVGQKAADLGGRLSWGQYAVAQEINRAIIGTCETSSAGPDKTIIAVRPARWSPGDQPKMNWRTLAMAVHMRCWKLARHILGPGLETEYLQPAVALLLIQARARSPGKRMEDEYNRADEEPLKIVKMKDLIEGYGRGKRGEDTDTSLDDEPLQVFKTKSLIQASDPAKASPEPSSTLSLLPYDIRCEILGYLDHQAVSRLLEAVEYPLEDSYWRSRAAFYLLGMDDIIHKQKEVDWRGLCLAAEGLDAATDVFRIRHRVVDTLMHVKAQLRRVRKGDISISLPGVFDQVQDEMLIEYRDNNWANILGGGGEVTSDIEYLLDVGVEDPDPTWT